MEVLVADKCGFCLGVNSAIELAKKTLTEQSNVYSLGPLIHNQDVVEELAQSGLKPMAAATGFTVTQIVIAGVVVAVVAGVAIAVSDDGSSGGYVSP